MSVVVSTKQDQVAGRTAPSGALRRSAGSSQPPPKRRDLVASLSDPTSLLILALIGGAFIALFHTWFITQHEHSWGNGDWSHAYIVPFISVYLLWQHKWALERVPMRRFWPGLAPMLLGIVSYVHFIVGTPNHMGQGFAMILTLFGVVLLMLGPAAMKYLFFPIAYLVFAVTVSEKIMIEGTFPLQHLASEGAWILQNAIGVRTDIAGNVLTVIAPNGATHALNVAEQCSGMRMVVAFIALGTAVALVGTRMWWKRVVLVVLAVPIAVLLNVVRIAVLGALTLVDPRFSTGEAHTFIGTLLLVPGFVLYLLVVVALNKAVPEAEGSVTEEDAEDFVDPDEAGLPAVGGMS